MSENIEYMTYDEARTRKVAAEAEIAELELSKIRGDLAVVEDIAKAWDDVLSAMKAKLLALPTKIGPSLAAEEDAFVIQNMIEEQIKECLDELSNYEPLSDPTGEKVAVVGAGSGDEGAQATTQANNKRVGRPKKTSKLSK